jgi:hypothetical protein
MTEPVPTAETARALLRRHGLPEGVIDGALALFAQELAGKIRAWHDRLPSEHECCDGNAADLIDPANWARAVPADAPPETVHACPPDGSGLTPCCGRTPFELPGTDRMTTGPSAVTCSTVEPPVDRPAVLREAADELGRMDYDVDASDYGWDTYREAWNSGVMDGADLLRRMAAEVPENEASA